MATFTKRDGKIYIEVNTLLFDVLNIAINAPNNQVSDAFSEFHKVLTNAQENAERFFSEDDDGSSVSDS